ncbi:PSD1 and planctomycete cytochrome C domain-containing protein [Zavarzinella formosa]|uniref:PSD1 and planctomycete cytochrome C domain-containing protein n=1 Tax=Zavarzinella formosa TaxID=360055 RepID=UPI000496BB4F|nr:PSD1 and planctomycete cytochrome C domain-containing protein [Zavarzinella formosa]
MRRLLSSVVLLVIAVPVLADEHFEKRIRPLLVERCFECHGPKKAAGGLRLDSREAILKGGDSGPAAVPEKPEMSNIIRAVEHRDDLRMPPKMKLPDGDITALRQWVAKGMPWPASKTEPGETTGPVSTFTDAQRKWWSFQSVRSVSLPTVKNAAWAKTDIDRFILAGLETRGIAPNNSADRRTLIRRATYDLTGLPPTPEEVDAFLKDDRPDAFAQVVERLLASKSYGERWGRHWLDLVRYADTAGDNSDHPVPQLWRYRNWVIDSFNKDQAYDEFIREQVAGDLIAATGPPERYADRVTATGFLAVARRFGHDVDKDIHLTHEDIIDTMGRAFMGMSLACARCHDHKYDPLTARDYYAIQGILQSTNFSFPGCEAKQQPRDPVPLLSPGQWAKTVEPHQRQLAAIDEEIRQLTAKQAPLSQQLKSLVEKSVRPLAKGEIADGKSQDFTGVDGKPFSPVSVSAGQMLRLSVFPQKNHGADTTLIEWEIAEVGGMNRRWNLTKDVIDSLLAGNPHNGGDNSPARWWFLDGRDTLKLLPEPVRDLSGKPGLNVWRNGETPSVFVNAAKEPVSVWTKLPGRSLFVHPAPDGPVAVAWASPFEGTVQITGHIADAHPGGPDGVSWTFDHITADLSKSFAGLAEIEAKKTTLAKQRAELVARAPKQELAYAAFDGTEAHARIHLRGDPEKLGPVVPRRWLEILGGQPVPTGKGSGRLQLADWLSDAKNPLAARVMVNRIWQHHFGRGLVRTPNDFGTRGQQSTHPELLDWLAAKFVASGWSIKTMHRQIMLSSAYQQSAAGRDQAAKIDPNNELCWKFDRRRLSAEELRDSLLTASGQLDRQPGGPHPFPPENTWNFSQHVPFSALYDSDKRSVYLISLRNRRHPFLGLFDGADPNTTTPQRQVTTVPTQALYFLNDPFFHAQAAKVAGRLPAQADTATRFGELCRIVFQRTPTANEIEMATNFLAAHAKTVAGQSPAEREKAGWATLVRIVLASNEFLYLE